MSAKEDSGCLVLITGPVSPTPVTKTLTYPMSTQENGALLADDETKLREALAAGPTPGPWRWEFNASSKDVSLVGGRIRYDVTVMDFTRWGMGGAVPRFVEPTDIPNGLQLLHKLSDRKDWIAPLPDREHHADWCAQVTHPDARWMQEAAPDRITRLLDELQRLRAENERLREDVLAGLRIANELTLETQTVEEMAADLVRQVRQARAAQRAADPGAAGDAEFLSLRLSRLAKLLGYQMPNGSHEFIAGVAGTLLGRMASHIEHQAAAPAPTGLPSR